MCLRRNQFKEDTSMQEFMKCTWQYDLQKRKEASALVGNTIVSAVLLDIEQDTGMLPQ